MPAVEPAASSHVEGVRQRIIEGAGRAFATSGFQGTSVPEIAREAGVSVGLLYRYFQSKADLFIAICMAELDSEVAALSQQLSEIPNPSERLRQGVEFYLDNLERPGGAGVILGALAEAPSNEEVRRVLRLRAQTVRDFVKGYLEEGVRLGEVPTTTPVDSFADAISLTLDGVIAAWAVEGPDFDPPKARDAIVSLLSAALGRPPLPSEM